jgi:FlaG/FlaF family flagellin (archaellin)
LGRRAISNVIAVMLLLLIAVTGASIFYVYASGIFGLLQGAQPQQSYMEHIALEYYDWTASPLQIRIRNVGSANILVKDVFISGTIVTSSSITWGTTGDPCQTASPLGSIAVSTSCWIKIIPPSSLTFQSGVAYSVSFVTSTGGKTTFSVIYGQTS